MDTQNTATEEQLEAADLALRFVFPRLIFTRSQISPDAAHFAFRALRAVNAMSRASYASFSIFQAAQKGGLSRNWASIPRDVVTGTLLTLKAGKSAQKNQIAQYFLSLYYERLLQKHLQSPDMFPCPEFQVTNTLLDRLVFGEL